MAEIGKLIIVIVDDGTDVEIQYVGELLQNGKSTGATRGNEKQSLPAGRLNAIKQIAAGRRLALENI